MDTKRITIYSILVAFCIFLVVFFLIAKAEGKIESNKYILLKFVGPFVGSVVGIFLIVSYFILSKKKPEYQTFPIYGASAIFEGWSEVGNELYGGILTLVSTIVLLLAISIDVKKKTGLYLLFRKMKEKGNSK